MARPNRIHQIAAQRGEVPQDMMLNLLNERETVRGVAEDLQLSYQTVWGYVDQNFKRRCTWEPKRECAEPASVR